MSPEELRQEYERFLVLKSLDDCEEIVDVYLNFFMKVIQEEHLNPVSKQLDADAKIIIQMFFTKMLTLKNALKGIDYTSKDGSILNNIIDPTTFIPIIRTIYESVCAFEIIYIIPDNDDNKSLIYNLWVKSGLEYRQRFSKKTATTEFIEKLEEEKNTIDSLKKEIEGSSTYLALPTTEQKKIQNAMKEKDYKIHINGSVVNKLSWGEIPILFGGTNTEEIFDKAYNYFSLYTHPSQVSVFQFQEMFNSEKPYVDIILFNTQFALGLVSIFLADYIKIYPDYKKHFMSEDTRSQMILDMYNSWIRGDDYLIDTAWVKALNS